MKTPILIFFLLAVITELCFYILTVVENCRFSAKTSGLTYAIDSLIGINNLEVFKVKKKKARRKAARYFGDFDY